MVKGHFSTSCKVSKYYVQDSRKEKDEAKTTKKEKSLGTLCVGKVIKNKEKKWIIYYLDNEDALGSKHKVLILKVLI